MKTEKKIVKTRFEVTTTREGKIYAEVGDVITLSDKGSEYYYIKRINATNIFSRWMRKAWINAKCL